MTDRLEEIRWQVKRGWYIGAAQVDVPWLLGEIDHLHVEIEDLREEVEFHSDDARILRNDVDRLRRGRDIWRADRDDLEERLSLLLWELTDCKLSKSGYDVRTMVSEIEATFERYAEMDRAELQADRDSLAATVERVRAIAESHIGSPCGCNAIAYQIRAAIEGTES